MQGAQNSTATWVRQSCLTLLPAQCHPHMPAAPASTQGQAPTTLCGAATHSCETWDWQRLVCCAEGKRFCSQHRYCGVTRVRPRTRATHTRVSTVITRSPLLCDKGALALSPPQGPTKPCCVCWPQHHHMQCNPSLLTSIAAAGIRSLHCTRCRGLCRGRLSHWRVAAGCLGLHGVGAHHVCSNSNM